MAEKIWLRKGDYSPHQLALLVRALEKDPRLVVKDRDDEIVIAAENVSKRELAGIFTLALLALVEQAVVNPRYQELIWNDIAREITLDEILTVAGDLSIDLEYNSELLQSLTESEFGPVISRDTVARMMKAEAVGDDARALHELQKILSLILDNDIDLRFVPREESEVESDELRGRPLTKDEMMNAVTRMVKVGIFPRATYRKRAVTVAFQTLAKTDKGSIGNLSEEIVMAIAESDTLDEFLYRCRREEIMVYSMEYGNGFTIQGCVLKPAHSVMEKYGNSKDRYEYLHKIVRYCLTNS